MEIRRFYVSKTDFDGQNAVIRGGEFVHAVRVLRQKVGYTLIFCLGDGYDYFGEITAINKDNLVVKFIEKKPNEAVSGKDITLFQGSLKNKNDFVVQKAVELGVNRVVFFVSKYVTERNVSVDRLNKIAVEACKQCKRADLVEVSVAPFEDVIESSAENALLFYENERVNRLKDVDLDGFGDVKIIIGSEGGFSEDEVEAFRRRGANVLSLGARILRAETAAVAAIALVTDKIGAL